MLRGPTLQCGKLGVICAYPKGDRTESDRQQSFPVARRAGRTVKKRENVKLDRYLHRNRALPVLVQGAPAGDVVVLQIAG